MLICPIENTAFLSDKTYIQKRPRVTQVFGGDFYMANGKLAYASMGLKGHNGIDFGVPIGTPIFAPMDGVLKVQKDTTGYGVHVKIRSLYGREVVLGHLSWVNDSLNGQVVYAGQFIAKSGNTGFSTAPHLHLGFRRLIEGKKKNIWDWSVQDYNNGYLGYVDILDSLLTGKGTLGSNNYPLK